MPQEAPHAPASDPSETLKLRRALLIESALMLSYFRRELAKADYPFREPEFARDLLLRIDTHLNPEIYAPRKK